MQILYPVLEWQANSILSTAHFRNSSKDFFGTVMRIMWEAWKSRIFSSLLLLHFPLPSSINHGAIWMMGKRRAREKGQVFDGFPPKNRSYDPTRKNETYWNCLLILTIANITGPVSCQDLRNKTLWIPMKWNPIWNETLNQMKGDSFGVALGLVSHQ